MSRYFAFISYSHADAATARWLHKSLETYRLPRAVRSAREAGALPERLAPVFLDRAELATSTELGAEIEKALGESENLIVLCSPQAARSRWVNEEIRRFGALGREDRVFCVIVPSDERGAGDGVFFPPALLERRGSEPL
ncbi:MAG TPA: toll/interleukin-1 receptor domain-containing protein, partial [Myxococcota bacterium]|nr:toll/interleukin-1 receptor domain-containing protein [Myxococcota bacterium]